MHRCICILCLFSCSQSLLAQDGDYQLGAAGSGLAGASLTVDDSWSIFNNVGALGRYEGSAVMAGYRNKYNVSAFQIVGAGFAHHLNWATIGASYHRFGDDLLNQQKLGVAISNKIQMVSLGLGINLIQYYIEGQGTQRRAALEFGGVVKVIPELSLGMHLFNLKENQIVPTVMKAGLSYRPASNLMINLETEKQLRFREVVKVGLSYQLITPLYLRTGFASHPNRGAFGIGIILDHFAIDYAYTSDINLGAIHELSLSYQLSKK